MKEDVFQKVFIISRENLTLFLLQMSPITKTCLFCFNGRTLYTSIPKHLWISHLLHFGFLFFMNLHTSSYVAYDITATNLNGMDVS